MNGVFNKYRTLKCEASLQRLLRKLKQKNIFYEIEFDKFYLSDSAPAHIFGTPKMYKFTSSDSFLNSFPTKSRRQWLFAFCADAHEPFRTAFMTMS